MPHPTADIDAPIASVSQPARPWLIAILLALGIACWWFLGKGLSGAPLQWMCAIAAMVVGAMPGVSEITRRAISPLHHPSLPRTLVIAGFIVLVVPTLLYLTAISQGRDFNLILHDEYSYRIQTLMLARGALWQPAHELADFFDGFQLLVRPVYASAYFPGTALLGVLCEWLHLPHWVMPLVAAGLVAGLIYLNITLLIDGFAGLLAVVMLFSVTLFRTLSIMLLAQIPTLAMSLGTLACLLIWQRTRQRWLLIVGGFAFGWALLTRPLDAACFVPVIIFLTLQPRLALPRLRRLFLLATGLFPLIGLQLLFNRGVAGSFFDSPYSMYARADNPGLTLGFHPFDPTTQPASPLQQKQLIYQQVTAPLIADHRPGNIPALWWNARLPAFLLYSIPHPLLLILFPAGILWAMHFRLWILILPAALTVAVYVFYPFFLPHYALMLAGGTIAACLGGQRLLAAYAGTFQSRVRFMLACATLALCVTSWPGIDVDASDQMLDATFLRQVDDQLAAIPDARAVVLFRFSQKRDLNLEPVYNVETARIDDSRVIRAHDLGRRNPELFDYFARHQPDRVVYLFDESDNVLTRLGLPSEIRNPPVH